MCSVTPDDISQTRTCIPRQPEATTLASLGWNFTVHGVRGWPTNTRCSEEGPKEGDAPLPSLGLPLLLLLAAPPAGVRRRKILTVWSPCVEASSSPRGQIDMAMVHTTSSGQGKSQRGAGAAVDAADGEAGAAEEDASEASRVRSMPLKHSRPPPHSSRSRKRLSILTPLFVTYCDRV